MKDKKRISLSESLHDVLYLAISLEGEVEMTVDDFLAMVLDKYYGE